MLSHGSSTICGLPLTSQRHASAVREFFYGSQPLSLLRSSPSVVSVRAIAVLEPLLAFNLVSTLNAPTTPRVPPKPLLHLSFCSAPAKPVRSKTYVFGLPS